MVDRQKLNTIWLEPPGSSQPTAIRDMWPWVPPQLFIPPLESVGDPWRLDPGGWFFNRNGSMATMATAQALIKHSFRARAEWPIRHGLIMLKTLLERFAAEERLVMVDG